MNTSPLKYLATILTCGAMVAAAGDLSAQTQPNEFSQLTARPLPPLPAASPGQLAPSAKITQSQFSAPVDSDGGRWQPKTLFTIQSPPVPPNYNVKARIIRPGAAELVSPPEPPQLKETQQNAQLISSPFNATTVPQTNETPLPAFGAARLAQRPESPFAQPTVARPTGAENKNDKGEFLVSFQNIGGTANTEPALDPPAANLDAAEGLATELPDSIAVDPESFDDLESNELESNELESDELESGELEPGDDNAVQDKDRQPENLDDLDEDLDGDDLDDDTEVDEDLEDDLQPEPRQFGVWPKKSIQEVRADVRNFGEAVPADESNALIASTQRYYRGSAKTEKVFAWAAPRIRHQPLYFEDAQLERYGQTKGLIKQPFVSGFKFFRDAALLPLNAAIDCPGSCDGPLGFCRPGSSESCSGCSQCQR